MMKRTNDLGGTTWILADSDVLDDLPPSHRDIVSDSLRAAYSDPRRFVRIIAEQTSIRTLRDYLINFAEAGHCSLVVADYFNPRRSTFGALQWTHQCQHYCFIAPAVSQLEEGPLAPFYSLLHLVHWDHVGHAGGLLPLDEHITLRQYADASSNPTFPLESSQVFGISSCGDAMLYNSAGEAGYFSHEDGSSYVIGSFVDMVNWVFGKLLRGESPEFDYSQTFPLQGN